MDMNNKNALSEENKAFLRGYDACVENVKQYFTIAKLMGAEKVNPEQVLLDSLKHGRETIIDSWDCQ